ARLNPNLAGAIEIRVQPGGIGHVERGKLERLHVFRQPTTPPARQPPVGGSTPMSADSPDRPSRAALPVSSRTPYDRPVTAVQLRPAGRERRWLPAMGTRPGCVPVRLQPAAMR